MLALMGHISRAMLERLLPYPNGSKTGSGGGCHFAAEGTEFGGSPCDSPCNGTGRHNSVTRKWRGRNRTYNLLIKSRCEGIIQDCEAVG